MQTPIQSMGRSLSYRDGPRNATGGGTGGGLAKLGGGTLEIDGGLSLGTNSSLAVNGGKLLLKVTSGAASVGSGVTANITGSAVLEFAGSVSSLSAYVPAYYAYALPAMRESRSNASNRWSAPCGILGYIGGPTVRSNGGRHSAGTPIACRCRRRDTCGQSRP